MSQTNAEMVKYDLREKGIRDERVLEAFFQVDRKPFVPPMSKEWAYTDRALRIAQGQTISQPYMVALMLEALKFTGKEKTLEIGTGSGYQTALLSRLSQEVWSVERLEPLATAAEDLLEKLEYKNIRYHLGDGSLGWPLGAPYNRIVVSAACPHIPEALIEQLAEGGMLAAPVGSQEGQDLVVGIKRDGRLVTEKSTPCMFVPLIGANGFKSADLKA